MSNLPDSNSDPSKPSGEESCAGPWCERRRFCWWAACTALIWAVIFLWLGAQSDDWAQAYRVTGKQSDYYNLLVDGFLSGHLYLKAEVSPDRLSPNPEVRRRAPYLLDAALYGRHYYLYYGVTPAVCLLLPYTALTGQQLGLETANLVFWAFGFAISLVWLWRWHRDHGAGCGPGFAVIVVSLLAALPATTFLVRRAFFYELPIAAGYAFLALLFLALYEIGHQRAPLRWLAIASASVGFAVGCRPNHLLMAPLVGWAAWRITRAGPRARAMGCWLAAIVPAALLGLMLAGYNFARFGNPMDFGFSHGVNSFFDAPRPLFDLRFLRANLAWYLFTPPSFSCYFPFIFPSNAFSVPANYGNAEAIHGFLAGTLVMAWIGLGFILTRNRGPAGRPVFPWMGLLLAGALVEMVGLCALAIRANRYTVDFLTPLAFAFTAAAGIAWSRLEGRAVGRLWRGGLALLTVGVSLQVTAAAVQLFDQFRWTRPKEFAAWSERLNPPRRWFKGFALGEPGRLRLMVRFRQPASARIEPLVVTGLPIYNDGVYVVTHPNGYMDILLEHHGYGGPRSGLIPVVWNRDYQIDIQLGSFFPPAQDPWFAGLDPKKVAVQKTTAIVEIDGSSVLDRRMAFYDAPPWALYLGADPMGETGTPTRFSGRIVSWRRMPLGSESATTAAHASGLFSFQLDVPPQLPTGGQPILAAGLTGRGSLLFLDCLPDGRCRLAVDEWGHGLLAGDPFPLTANQSHVLELVVGPVAARNSWPPAWTQPPAAGLSRSLLAWLDHRLVADFVLKYNLDAFDIFEVGSNSAGFSTAQANFAGRLVEQPLDQDARRDLLARAASVLAPLGSESAATAAHASGLFSFQLDVPPQRPTGGQPILAAGRTGRGSLLFLDCLPDGRCRLAVDAWGHGLLAGDPFPLTANQSHVLELVVGPVAARNSWPPAWTQPPAAGLSRTLLAWLDHRLVANFVLKYDLDAFDPLEVGSNSAGFTTAQADFGGHLVEQPLDQNARRDLLARAAAVLAP